jgi:hypothetical protein
LLLGLIVKGINLNGTTVATGGRVNDGQRGACCATPQAGTA